MQTKTFIFIGFIAVSFLLLVVINSVHGGGLVMGVVKLALLVIAALLDILAFASRYYTYLIVPTMQQRKHNIVLSNENANWLSSTSDAVMQKAGEMYAATVYISIPFYRSSTEMNDQEKVDFTRQVSRLAGLSKDPVRFTTELYVMNKDSYIMQLRDKINLAESDELKLTEANAPAAEVERVKGTLSMWRKMLDYVSASTSLELANFATISALGYKEVEAASAAQQKARELMTGIGATLGVSPSIVTGDNLLKFIEPEYLIPYSTVSEQISRGIQEQVV